MKNLFHLSLLFVAVLYSCSSQKTTTKSNFKTVTGVVIIEDDKLPLPGATVQVKQKRKDTPKRVTTADVYGKFTIEVKKGEILIISSICFEPKEIKITDENEYKVYLKNNCRIWI